MFDLGVAHAAAPASAAAGQGFMSFLPLILIFGVFYFLLIRPQQKKAKEHQNFLAGMEKGTTVVTSGGLHGVITGLTDTVVTLEIAEKIRVKVSRQHILGTALTIKGGDAEACKTGGG